MGSGGSRYDARYAAPRTLYSAASTPYMSPLSTYGTTGFPLTSSPLMGTNPYMSSNYPYMSSSISPLLISSYGSPLSYGGYGSQLGNGGYGSQLGYGGYGSQTGYDMGGCC